MKPVWISKQKFEGYGLSSFKCDICGMDRYCARVEFYLPDNYSVRLYKMCVFCVEATYQAIFEEEKLRDIKWVEG